MTVRLKIGLIMFLAVVIIIASGFLSYRSLSSIAHSISNESGPDLTSYKIKEIANDLEKAENSIRIYSISRDEKFLAPYYEVAKEIDQKVSGLKTYKKYDPVLSAIIDSIGFLIEEKLLVWHDILIVYDNNNIEKKLNEISHEIDSVKSIAENDTVKKSIFNRVFKNKKGKLEKQVQERQVLLDKVETLKSSKEHTDELIEKKEMDLAKTSTRITDKLYDLIAVIEKKENIKLKLKAQEAQALSKETYIWIGSFSIFGTLLALLALFILSRYIRKSNAYQLALQESKKAAEDLVKAKEMFIANVSHELRTPMNAISGFAEQMLASRESNHQHLQIIKSSSDHLLHLINDLLDYSKLQANKIELKKSHFITIQVINDVVQMFKVQAHDMKVELSVNFAPQVPAALVGDAFRLKQVLINLLGNAIKFSPNGSVDISLDANTLNSNEVLLEITVSDTGIGIDKDKLDSIFQDFTQEDADISRKFGGTGLGLSIVKKLVDLHHGEIKVESVKNIGSTFKCTLPYLIGDPAKVKFSSSGLKPPDLTGSSVLIVDDAEYNRMLLDIILRKWGASVHQAENGMEAIEKIKKTQYNMVFLDLRMPVLDGVKTAKFIRQGMKLSPKDLPIIMISAMSPKEGQDQFATLGINDYIVKPVSEATVMQVLSKLNFASTSNETVPQKATPSHNPNHEAKTDLLNLDELNRLAGNDSAFVNTLLQKLIELSDVEFENLQQAIEGKQWKRIADTAHKMAPPYRHVGNGQLLILLKDIEKMARNNEGMDQIVLKTDEAVRQYKLMKQEIDVFLASV
jgi:signal transduction histidine kinase/CheY-like chemotaxis protein/CHASE3 domain sensor protein